MKKILFNKNYKFGFKFKFQLSLFLFTIFTMTYSFFVHAENLENNNKIAEIKFNNSQFILSGNSSQHLQFNALLIYAPVNSADKLCQFKVDQLTPQGNERNMNQIIDTDSKGDYNLAFPLNGFRNKCAYELKEVLLNIKTEEGLFQVVDILNLKDVQAAEKLNAVAYFYPDFASKLVSCDFSNTVMFNCDLAPYYQANFVENNIRLNFINTTDYSEKN